MDEMDGKRWAVVVYGTPLVLLGLVAIVGLVLFVVPGAPCQGTTTLSPPEAEVAVATNGSGVAAVVVGDRPLGGETTDRVTVSIRDAESDRSASRTWLDGGGELEPGATLAFSNRSAGFAITARDEVTVRWFGADPGVASFCPNGRTFSDLARVRVANASRLLGGG